MAKSITTAFDGRLEAQQRLTLAGGSIGYRKGKPVFQFPSKAQYDEYLSLGAEAYKRKVGLA
ncbi:MULTISPECIES: hypothetical protein [Bacillus]|uniref:Uncharacterized protein n=2 Tax=Bacillus TaxID=1386 RepID=A0A0M4G8Z4_9BACI|nr:MULTISPECIES: hypothetical protein [Bacillus]ALC81753.1 hypothetical protein AM592_09145 [Bacillus gobiensis]MBP1080839.1 hypothetical protein [Bacillus capparidis]MED1097482.1 hypothetical protein [Bacillus capparidis]